MPYVLTHIALPLAPQVQPVVRPIPLPDQGQEQAGSVEETKDKAGGVDKGKEQAAAAAPEVGSGMGEGNRSRSSNTITRKNSRLAVQRRRRTRRGPWAGGSSRQRRLLVR